MAHNSKVICPGDGMESTTLKQERLNIRCDQRAKQLLDTAASYAHVSVSEFVLSHALASAEQVIQSHQTITLSPDDFQAFLVALDQPAGLNPALQRAFARHAKQVRR
jgi:uncharacterized protein (DUF1778 family)